MSTTQKDAASPHIYGGSDPDNRKPPPANGMRGEGAVTPLETEDPKEPGEKAPDKHGR